MEDKSFTMTYKNWRGETGIRKVSPISLWFGKTDYHPNEGWLLKAMDLDKNAERDFAIDDIVEVHQCENNFNLKISVSEEDYQRLKSLMLEKGWEMTGELPSGPDLIFFSIDWIDIFSAPDGRTIEVEHAPRNYDVYISKEDLLNFKRS